MAYTLSAVVDNISVCLISQAMFFITLGAEVSVILSPKGYLVVNASSANGVN